ncbi:MAG: protein phosphatase CheZ [Desulfovibrio sp.]|jgi:chemotaxis protein CheZ|nr:protein phosphatase CheZ [Desulfovibrio sp.]
MVNEQTDQAVYKQLSANMREGLKDIYQQISNASADNAPSAPLATDALLHEASDQLHEVLKTTENAAMTIMEIVEKHLDLHEENAAILSAAREGNFGAEQIARLAEINAILGEDLSNVLTALSFQDITGQRIKKVVAALSNIEKSVVELYVSSGLIMDSAEKNPARDAESLQDEARQAVEDFRRKRKVTSTLKGPDSKGISQSSIDDMLAQLNM